MHPASFSIRYTRSLLRSCLQASACTPSETASRCTTTPAPAHPPEHATPCPANVPPLMLTFEEACALHSTKSNVPCLHLRGGARPFPSHLSPPPVCA